MSAPAGVPARLRRWGRRLPADWREPPAVAAVGVLATLVLTWPLPAHLGSRIWGPAGDNYEFLWKMWWVPHQLLAGHSPFADPAVFPQAGGYDLGTTDLTPAASFLFAPVTIALGQVFAYNLVLLLSFPTAVLGVHLLARRLGAAPVAATVAGLVFAFMPFHLWQGWSHLNTAQVGYLPFAYWAADRLLEHRRRRDGVVLGLLAALAVLTSWYVLGLLLLSLPPFLLVRRRQLGAPWGRLGAPVAVAGAVAAVLVLPFLVPTLRAQGASVAGEQAFLDDTFYSASLEDYVMPPPDHPVTGYWIDAAFATGNFERVVYPGLGILALALVAPATRLRRGALPALTLAGVGVLLSLGPVLHWFGAPVVVEAGGAAAGRLHEVAAIQGHDPSPDATALPLPLYPLDRWVTAARSLRVWVRAGVIADLGLALAAALSLTALLARIRRPPRRLACAGAVLAVLIADAWTGHHGLETPGPRPVDLWLAGQPGDFRIAELPYELAQRTGLSLYRSEFHGKAIVGAQSSVVPAEVLAGETVLDATFPQGQEWIGVLQRWQVRYLLLDSGITGDPDLPGRLAARGFAEVTRQGTVDVLRVPGVAPG